MSRFRPASVQLVLALIMSQLLAGTTVAGDPTPPVIRVDGTPQLSALYGWDGETYIPLTQAETKLIERKKELARQAAANTIRTPAPNGVLASCRNGVCGVTLPVFYRHQTKSYYCGPAAVQAISTHAWGMPSGSNKYSQQYISDAWTQTDASGQTFVWRERLGLTSATAGRYRWPYGEEYVNSGYHWHDERVVQDITDWNMPLVAGVAPHDPNFGYYLVSWPTAITAGHYIAVRGWLYLWDGTRTPQVYYLDGSGGYGGSDGAFGDPSFDVYQTIKKSNPVHSEGWIIW